MGGSKKGKTGKEKVENPSEILKVKPKETALSEERFQAKVVEIIGRTGVRGEATQVRVKILTGRDKDKIIRRNIRGPVRLDDTLMMLETEMEASPLSTGGGKGVKK